MFNTEEGQDEYEKDGFIVDEDEDEEDPEEEEQARESSDDEAKAKKKKRKKRYTSEDGASFSLQPKFALSCLLLWVYDLPDAIYALNFSLNSVHPTSCTAV